MCILFHTTLSPECEYTGMDIVRIGISGPYFSLYRPCIRIDQCILSSLKLIDEKKSKETNSNDKNKTIMNMHLSKSITAEQPE